jgi:hypothetical protein
LQWLRQSTLPVDGWLQIIEHGVGDRRIDLERAFYNLT